MDRKFYICLFIIFLAIDPFEVVANMLGPPWRHGRRSKRAAGDPKTVLINRIPNILTSFLTSDQLGDLFDLVTESYFNGTDMSGMESVLMNWAMGGGIGFSQMMEGMSVYTTLTNELNGTGTDPMTLVIKLVGIMTNNLTPFMNQVETKMNQMKTKGRSQNATIREAYIMCIHFFKKKTVSKIINRIKKNFSPVLCEAAYNSLNPTFLNLDLYNFNATPCTGS